jgi:hypothetical protein
MKISLLILSLLIVLIAVVFFGDRVVASYKFKAICEKYAKTVIYEQVYLPDDYFSPPGTEPGTKRYWYFGMLGNLLTEKLELDYPEKSQESFRISDWGPIHQMRRSFVRKRDGKVMSEIVHFANKLGWFSRTSSFGYAKEVCMVDYDGELLYGSTKPYMELIERTFCRADGRCFHAPSKSIESQ